MVSCGSCRIISLLLLVESALSYSIVLNGLTKKIQSLGFVAGILKGRLNLNYSASRDINSVHRALHIIQPGPDLSGNYTCTVSTLNGEDSKTKGMLVLGESLC